ncbi:MAG: hypothetical protein A3F41_07335 [Coxiella sp. RIFCSPHIGHO2_12_FULL_44_14]|nr:MAG: hypothetical protein A3F41_07335 [Coxiella sp. RIFCSPHIGHO2_12_FULL_44_14]
MIAIAYTSPLLESIVRELANELALPIVSLENKSYPLLLVLTETHLELRDLTDTKLNPIWIDFLSSKLTYRQKHGGGRGQMIARAVGVKPKTTLRVLDLTAGMGEDAFVLAALGCHVTMIERHPIMAALLRDGLRRLHATTELPLQLIQTSSAHYLKNLATDEMPDVIYLDPMFPESGKTALRKKEMRVLRKLVGDDADAHELLALALTQAKKRVVVKRPRRASALNHRQPQIVFSGKSNRFDVYLSHI